MSRRAPNRLTAMLFALAAALPAAQALGHDGAHSDEARLEQVDFEQRLGATLPPDTEFLDARGQPVAIADLAEGRPLALMLVWLDCPNLCPILLGETANAAATLPFAPEEYRVAVVGIDPEAGPAKARDIRARLQRRHGEAIANWRFLTGTKAAIDRLADAVGFQYAYDAEDDMYAHPAGLIITAAGGEVSRYLFGLRPAPQDLRLALIDAGRGEVGSATDQVLLRCFRFDPQNGQYSLAVMRLIQWVGGGFGLAMVGTVFWLRRRERD